MRDLEGYMHGVNLGGWLSQCDHTKERYDNFIVEKDFEVIKNWGLDHVRVPVDYNLVEDEDGNYKEDGFAYIQKAIDWSGKYGLNMVLDLHKTYGFSFDKGYGESGFFDNEDYQERFYRLWNQFSSRFGKYSDRVIFEMLNEITDKEYAEKWYDIATRCIEVIRKNAPDVKILLGGYHNNAIEALKDLPRFEDKKIIYNFHCYEPLIFTHQGAHWADGMDTSFRMPFESTYGDYNRYSVQNLDFYCDGDILKGMDVNQKMNARYFENLVKEAVDVANDRDVALYCGEYGVIDRATPEDALKWYKLICSVYDKYNIGRAAWTYKEMDFGISDARMDNVRDEILKLL